MAGTVEAHVNRGGHDVLRGYRGAWYLGIGLGSLGMLVSVCFILFGSNKANKTDNAPDTSSEKSGMDTQRSIEDV